MHGNSIWFWKMTGHTDIQEQWNDLKEKGKETEVTRE